MQTNDSVLSLQDLVACHECDLVLIKAHVPLGFKASCPRCGTLVYEKSHDHSDSVLAMVLAGLFLFVPANIYPLFVLEMLGQSNQTTLVGAVFGIYDNEMYWVAAMVAFSSIIMPFLKLFLLAVVLLHVRFGVRSRFLVPFFRFYRHTDSWAMLEVYIISLLVTVIKMADFGDIQAGLGMYCFVLLFLFTLAATAMLDAHGVWKRIEALNQGARQ